MNLIQINIGLMLVYGLLIAVGGLIGYTQAKSLKSLGASLPVAGLLCLAAWLTSQNPGEGLAIATFTSLAMVAVFSKRYRDTRALMPAGLMLGLSTLFSLAMFYSWLLLKPVSTALL